LVERRAEIEAKADQTKEQKAREIAALDLKVEVVQDWPLPPRNIKPRNLRLGIYRGGRRPLDLYRRVYAGINGVPMPGMGPAAAGAKATLTPEEIWQLVDYVMSLPYESISRPPRPTGTIAKD